VFDAGGDRIPEPLDRVGVDVVGEHRDDVDITVEGAGAPSDGPEPGEGGTFGVELAKVGSGEVGYAASRVYRRVSAAWMACSIVGQVRWSRG
jgi:hypothetical protein